MLDKGHLSESFPFLYFINPSSFLQTFHTPSLGDEEFEIPPITPPPETEPGLGPEVDSPFPHMPEPPALHRGHMIPQFPPQSLDLPSITISRNMLDQEGMSVNTGHPVVSSVINTHKSRKPFSLSLIYYPHILLLNELFFCSCSSR